MLNLYYCNKCSFTYAKNPYHPEATTCPKCHSSKYAEDFGQVTLEEMDKHDIPHMGEEEIIYGQTAS